MQRKIGKKAFTLTELIVVIVIIGVLAAVLIPTLSGYVEKAKLAKDKSEVTNMNQLLNIDSIFDDVAYYDIDYVEKKLLSNGYDLKPTASGYTYWYDRATNCVKLEKTSSVLSDVVSADVIESFSRNAIEALSSKYPSYMYISKNDNVLTKTVEGIRNLVQNASLNCANKEEILVNMQTAFSEIQTDLVSKYSNLKEYVSSYSPSTALYVVDEGYYTSASVVSNVVFAKEITTIAPLEVELDINITSIEIPSTVVYVQSGAFTSKVDSTTKINTTSKVVFEEGSYVPGTVHTQPVQTIEVSDYDISYLKKDIIATSGVVTREKGTIQPEIQENVRCEYMVPTVKISSTSIPFAKLSSCVVRSTIEDGFVRMTLAALSTENKKYKLENIGYITNIDANSISYAKAKYDSTLKEFVPVINTVVNANIADEILEFLNFKDSEVIVEYVPEKINYKIEQTANGSYKAVETNRELMNQSLSKTISLTEFVQSKSNLYDILMVEEYNSLKIKTIKIVLGEQILFIQKY